MNVLIPSSHSTEPAKGLVLGSGNPMWNLNPQGITPTQTIRRSQSPSLTIEYHTDIREGDGPQGASSKAVLPELELPQNLVQAHVTQLG